MKKIYFILVLFICTFNLRAQINLIPNPSFENTKWCNDSAFFASNNLYSAPERDLVAFSNLNDWYNVNNYLSTPDLMSGCFENTICPNTDNLRFLGVPFNSRGWQYPHIGNNYAGFAFLFPPPPPPQEPFNGREYITTKFTSPLQAGVKYIATAYLSPAERINAQICQNTPETPYTELLNYGVTTNFIQMYVSNGEPDYDYYDKLLPLNAQIELKALDGSFITDTAGWTLVAGEYTAQGGEDRIIIGNFRDDYNTPWKVIGDVNGDILVNGVTYSNWDSSNTGYMYIDDVAFFAPQPCIIKGLDSLCNGATTTLVAEGIALQYFWYNMGGQLLGTDSTLNVSPTQTTNYILKTQSLSYSSLDTFTVRVCPPEVSTQNITLYPNPTEGNATLTYTFSTLAQNPFVTITDAAGRLVYTQTLNPTNGNQSLPTAQLAQGLYNVSVYTTNLKAWHSKLVVVK